MSAHFATLAMRLKRQPDRDVGTACVDDKTLRYNPVYWLNLAPDERTAVLAHEVVHFVGDGSGNLQRTGFGRQAEVKLESVLHSRRQEGFVQPACPPRRHPYGTPVLTKARTG